MIPDASWSPDAWAAVATWSAALAVALFVTPLLTRVAWATGYLDQPAARKLHLNATPLLGGVAVALGTALGVALGYWALQMAPPTPAKWWVAGALVSVLVGLVDDRYGMAPALKMLGQGFSAWLFLQGGIYPQTFFGPVWGQVISLLWLVGLQNAINFLDNMDGIVGGLTAICALAFAGLLTVLGRTHEALFALGLGGAALGFLRYNFRPARIFLGDAGSLFLGYSLGALGLVTAAQGPGLSGILASLLVLGYPLFDTTFVVITRLAEGRRIYIGGRDHTTHRMVRIIKGPRRTAFYVYAMTAALAGSGIWLGSHPGARYAIPLVVAWGILLTIIGRRLARSPQL
jgi:UDP-GlcNAc:undecaprenyl-phosphate GlcNAc-1-phosphate transferase